MVNYEWQKVERKKRTPVFDRIGSPVLSQREVRSRTVRSSRNAVSNISISIYITNFPLHVGVMEIRQACEKFGRVLDVFISKNLSKLGKRFGFVRFPKVLDGTVLAKDLCSIWMGSYKLFASAAVHPRGASIRPKEVPLPSGGGAVGSGQVHHSSYADAVAPKDYVGAPKSVTASVVLQSGDYVIDPQLAKQVVLGRIKDFASIMVLQNLCKSQGFPDVACKYMGGMWLLLEFPTVLSCYNFRCNETVRGWFHQLIDWNRDFIPQERLIWLDIEGLPLRAWCKPNFSFLTARWGKIVQLEESLGSNLASTRVCVESRHMDIISEMVSVRVDDVTCMVRVKEIMGWYPSFFDSKIDGQNEHVADAGSDVDLEEEDGISNHSVQDEEQLPGPELSPDPFNLRDLIWETTKPNSAKKRYINRINKEVEVEEGQAADYTTPDVAANSSQVERI
ncbi:hypothetical protein LXL04_009308 [Taraxacum kok-saghyz]